MRYAHVCTSHGVNMPAVSKAAAVAILANQAEAQLAKGRTKPRQTNVAKYVGRKSPAVARALRKVLKAWAKKIAPKTAKLYAEAFAEKLQKDTGSAGRILSIIEELNNQDLGVDLQGELEGPMLAAFKRAAAIGATQVGFELADITAQVDEQAVAFAADRGGELIKDLAGTTDDALKSLLARAVDEGMSADELSSAVEDLGAFSDYRADVIARTELAFAHVQGNVEGWKAAGDQVAGKRSILGDLHDVPDECDDAADAGVVALDDDFGDGLDYPPYHPNAVFSGCRFMPYGTPTRAVAAEYDGPAIALLAGNHRLTIGPNHPMLTSRGMKAAKFLQVGDELVCDSRVIDGSFADDSPGLKSDFDQVPLLQEAFDALKSVFGCALIPRSADDFHGDAVFCKGEVEVVFPDRKLLRELEPDGLEAFRECGLMPANMQLVPEASSGSERHYIGRVLLPAPSGVSRTDVGAFSASHFVLLRVDSVEPTRYVGTAYDYSTVSTLYCVDGFVVSNCMCDVVPVLSDSGDE